MSDNLYAHTKVSATVSEEPQSGKSYETILQAADACVQGKTVNYVTHALNDIKNDFLTKARALKPNIKWLCPTIDKKEFKYIKNHVMQYRCLPSENIGNTVFVGLNNTYHYQLMNTIFSLDKGVQEGFIDEVDTTQPGFGFGFKEGIQKDNWQDAIIEDGVYNRGGVNLITATKVLLAANNIHYKDVKVISPYDRSLWKGLKQVKWELVNERDIEQLYHAEFSNTIHQIIREEPRNTMINLSRFTIDHNRIIQGLTSVNSQLHAVNYNNSGFSLNVLEEDSHVLVGGAKFSRGISYPRIGTLIFDMDSDINTLIQAFGRLFRYASHDIRAVVTYKTRDLLEKAFEVESKMTRELLLETPKVRHQFLKKDLEWFDSLKLPEKSNGWVVTPVRDRRLVRPLFQLPYDTPLYGELRNTTSVTVPKKGAAPTRRGTTKWGSRSPEKMVSDFVEQHPQGKTLVEGNNKGSIRRKYIIPPYHYEADNKVSLEFALANDKTHWYVDNSMSIEDRENITTKYVDSVSACGKYKLFWTNLYTSDPQLRSSLDNKNVTISAHELYIDAQRDRTPPETKLFDNKEPSTDKVELPKQNWRDFMVFIMGKLGRRGNLTKDIYPLVEKYRDNPSDNYRATVRRILEQNSSDSDVWNGVHDLFSLKEKGSGNWSLRRL